MGTQLQGLILLLMALLLPKMPLAVSTMRGVAKGELWPGKGMLRQEGFIKPEGECWTGRGAKDQEESSGLGGQYWAKL